ncbi:DMT family transporter [bacterium]|nr:DMT family transporter [bacterium]
MNSPAAGRSKTFETGLLWTQGNALLAAANFVLGKFILGWLGAWRFSALVYLIAATVNTIWWYLSDRHVMPQLQASGTGIKASETSTRRWAYILGHCLFSASGVILLWLGIDLVPSHVAAILSRVEALVGIGLGLWWLGESFSGRQWLGVAITAAGVALIRWAALSGEALGFALLLGAAISLGLAQVLGKQALRSVAIPRLVLIRGWLLCAVFLAGWWIVEPGPISLDWKQWAWIVVSALIGPVFARNAYLLALSYLPVSQVVLFNQTQPLYAVLIAMLLLHEYPGLLTIAGALVIVSGLAVVLSARPRPAAELNAPPTEPGT